IRPENALTLNGIGKKVLLIDHQDSFVHTLANYIRQTGAVVDTIRFDKAADFLNSYPYDLVVLSPGPGRPQDFHLSDTIKLILAKKIPIFGVCLGLQGLVEYFGGDLDVLDYPMHGKSSLMTVIDKAPLFAGLGEQFKAGRYHSLYARKATMPHELDVTVVSDDEIIMAISHKTLAIHAVQFHPETILSLPNQAGLTIISNLMGMIG
ncbi:MAG: glutamine amidotransferase-related protein, partial [Legionella sp.]